MAGPSRLALCWVICICCIEEIASRPPQKIGAPRTELSHPCSRAVSRWVRRALDREVLRASKQAGITSLPPSCPWSSSRDLFGRHELAKRKQGHSSLGHSKAGSGTWTCDLCGKVFKNEHYLDLHLERRHMNETPKDGICLADYCEVFEVCNGDMRHHAGKEIPCDDTMLAVQRVRCETALKACFPLDQDQVSRRLHAQWSRQFCHSMNCTFREERKREHESVMMPVIVLILLIVMLGCMIFFVMVGCVDKSDDILQILQNAGIASVNFSRRFRRVRDQARAQAGLDRTRAV